MSERGAWWWWWWWWCGAVVTVALTAASPATQDPSPSADSRRSSPDLFEYLEGVGATLDLNDRRGENLYRVLQVARRSADLLAQEDAEEQRRPATSFFATNKFSLEMPPYIRPLRRRHRRCQRHRSKNHVNLTLVGRSALPQDTRGREKTQQEAMGPEEARGAEGGMSGDGERLQDVVPGLGRWHEPERLKVIEWHEEKRRPRVTLDKMVPKATAYWYVGLLVLGCGLVCCCSCLLVVTQHASPHFADNIGTCKWLLDDFLHCREEVLEIKRCLWRFQMVEPIRHDDLLLYVTQDLQHLHELYKREVLNKINEMRQPDERQYLENELRKKRKRKRKMALWGRILGM
ncbi:hypothetical protein E2C01_074552 [Portunus trituberculatus]|uniref:Uncharacterized protein n=1 Tax=Portunus trituberculatus TaxID=210409 RepID=A0A5B7I8B3_PORTR|nr:hypothetical protein [Portunus trituberculatus]